MSTVYAFTPSTDYQGRHRRRRFTARRVAAFAAVLTVWSGVTAAGLSAIGAW